MLWLFAGGIGLLMGAGTYLVLRARGFTVALGLMLLTYATNLFVFAAGGLQVGGAPVNTAMEASGEAAGEAVGETVGEAAGATAGKAIERMADPLPQALVLTAIVIGFAMTALVLVLILRALSDLGSERVDAQPGDDQPSDDPAGETQASDTEPGETRPPEAQRSEEAQ